jgi:hypothetical protein
VASLVSTIVFSRARVIFAASPPFLILILIGCGLATLASILSIVDQTANVCTAKTWLGHISFHFVFGAVFAKTWRLHRIFNNPVLRAIKVPQVHIDLYEHVVTRSLLNVWVHVDSHNYSLQYHVW